MKRQPAAQLIPPYSVAHVIKLSGEVGLGFDPSLRTHASSKGARLQISFLEVNPAVPA
jgi:hypothetical protein